jgi:hypothetical protein
VTLAGKPAAGADSPAAAGAFSSRQPASSAILRIMVIFGPVWRALPGFIDGVNLQCAGL